MSVRLTIKLKQIVYGGENIGDDLSFQFDVKGQITKITIGTTITGMRQVGSHWRNS